MSAPATYSRIYFDSKDFTDSVTLTGTYAETVKTTDKEDFQGDCSVYQKSLPTDNAYYLKVEALRQTLETDFSSDITLRFEAEETVRFKYWDDSLGATWMEGKFALTGALALYTGVSAYFLLNLF